MQQIDQLDATNSILQAAAPGATSAIILPGANVRGIVLLACSFVLNPTAAVAAAGGLRTTGTNYYILGGRVESGAILAVPFVLPRTIFIPAGVGLEFRLDFSAANVNIYGAYKLL